MQIYKNPFNELYVTETVSPDDFVQVFSPLLVSDTLPLFESGNVVLTGTQGSGKSMLLALLKPEIRVAYAKADVPFPLSEIRKDLDKFIGAGINLTTSGAIAIGQRQIEDSDDKTIECVEYYFGDHVNYWILRDMLTSLDMLSANTNEDIGRSLGLGTSVKVLDNFAVSLAHDEAWNGFLDGVQNYDELKQRIQVRLTAYRQFFRFNIEALPNYIKTTKTDAGEPLSVFAEHMWKSGVVPPDVKFFVQIDQYEELDRLELANRERGIQKSYRAVVDRMIARRDGRVSYRLGSRKHAWHAGYATENSRIAVEEFRNYEVVDLEELLRDRENRKGLFREFSDDVFQRRMTNAGYNLRKSSSTCVNYTFRAKVSPEERVKSYIKKGSTRFVNLEDSWPKAVCDLLESLAIEDPINEKLGEAWVRQQMEKDHPILPSEGNFPWLSDEKKWWRKERISQSLLQIASGNNQRMLWAGAEDIRGLSSGHILVFLSICKYIWSAWLRTDPIGEDELLAPKITDIYLQDAGIQQASTYWYRKVKTDTRGDTRRRFISFLGSFFRDQLRNDEKMSYPGASGFSASVVDLERDPEVWRFLEEAAAYGVLVEKRHTSRTKNRGESIKWYLHPILCPYFDIPYQHIKEPYEVNVALIRGWLSSDTVRAMSPATKTKNDVTGKDNYDSGQLLLFDDHSEEDN